MEYLTPEEAAKKLKIARRTLYLWLREGKINGKKMGTTQQSQWRIPESEIKRLLGDD